MQTTIALKCHTCKNPFQKLKAEYRRRKKLGQKMFFCSESCRSTTWNRLSPRGSIHQLNAGNRRDDLTPFRWFVARAVYRRQYGQHNLTPEYLKKLWESQKGICPLTGWDLILPRSTTGWSNGRDPKNASLDRINCNLGYVEGNVRFVSVMANLARCTFTDQQLVEFCRAVTETA